MTEPLSKVDSAVEGVDAGKDAKDTKKPRMSSIAAPGVWNIKDIGTFSPISQGLPMPGHQLTRLQQRSRRLS
jgi:uncharacterized protein (UPF0264 family)